MKLIQEDKNLFDCHKRLFRRKIENLHDKKLLAAQLDTLSTNIL
jgi:hypothetical protein